jgi:Kef-type K+ transport system membrane component KefB
MSFYIYLTCCRVLLALVVALLNSSGGLEALYVFLTTVGFALFLIIFIAPLYRRLAIKTGSFENGPSPFLMAVTLLLVLISAFVTDIIGKFSTYLCNKKKKSKSLII